MGGSAAGYARWQHFKLDGLKAYAKRRNDPLRDGTSRLSPYLHYGMVSPMRIAREAAASETAGAEKFLDELLVWRELAYNFCFFNHDLDSLAAVPDWARETLAEHESDLRPSSYSWETLARGKTGDRLWDAAQRSLLMQGELHNNVRMTWGKALLDWTPNAAAALSMMLDLNHRYALDGRDPASARRVAAARHTALRQRCRFDIGTGQCGLVRGGSEPQNGSSLSSTALSSSTANGEVWVAGARG